MTTHFKSISLFLALLLPVFACTDTEKNATTPSGLRHQFHVRSASGKKPAIGDIVTLHVLFKNSQDSVLQNTWESEDGPARVTLQQPTYRASLEEAISMLSVGDSATFYISADSVFTHTFRQPLPEDVITPGSDLTFTLKLERIQTPSEFIAEQKAVDQEILSQYLQQESIADVQQTASGLYYQQTKAGRGKHPAPGDTLQVHYIGKLLDGTIFDNSYERGEPIEFPFNTQSVIAGWKEGMTMLQKGGKATLFIPSGLAYGPSGLADIIPPNANLILEVELVDIH